MQMRHPFSKNDRTNVENDGLVSIRSNLPKLHDICIYNQMSEYLNKILSENNMVLANDAERSNWGAPAQT